MFTFLDVIFFYVTFISLDVIPLDMVYLWMWYIFGCDIYIFGCNALILFDVISVAVDGIYFWISSKKYIFGYFAHERAIYITNVLVQ